MDPGNDRWFEALLRLFPRDFRRLRGDDLRSDWAERKHESQDQGLGARARFRMSASVDLIRSALRLRARPPAPGRDVRTRMERGDGWMMTIFSGLRPAARSLYRTPGFSALVLTTLAVGIGMTTALFTVVDHILLRPLVYPDADRLVYVTQGLEAQQVDHMPFSGMLVDQVRENVAQFEAVEAVAFLRQNLTGASLPAQVQIGWSSPGFLSVLGPEIVRGRLMTEDDPEGTVVLSHALWQTQFGGDPEAVGRSSQLDGQPHTVVGILGPTFDVRLPTRRSIEAPALWKNPDSRWANGNIWERYDTNGLLMVVAKLTPDGTVEQANASLTALAASIRSQTPHFESAGLDLSAAPLQETVVQGVRPTILLLFGSVGLVLLIACFNVANLLLVRTHGRSREFAIRRAIGSSGARIGRLLLGESLLLALTGASLGLFVAWLALIVVQAIAPPQADWLSTVQLDGRILLFCLLAAVTTTVLVGVLPVMGASGAEPAGKLRGGRGASSGSSRVRDGLVVLQLGLSLILLVGAGLLTNSMIRLQAVDPGFDTGDLTTFSVSVPGARYAWPGPAANDFYRAVESGALAMPGVTAAGIAWPAPFSGAAWSGSYRTAAEDSISTAQRSSRYVLVTEGFFDAIEMPIVEGRTFGEGLPREVAIISRSVAEELWPGESAIGRQVMASPWGPAVAFEVIGLVEDARWTDLRAPAEPLIFFDTRGWSWVDWEVDVLVRSALGPAALAPGLREMVAALDSEVPVAELSSVEGNISNQMAALRFALGLVAVFAAVAALLALVGLYGVISWTVGQQRREIGIRIALGSGERRVLKQFLWKGGRLALIGTVLGLAGAMGLTRLLEAYLFGVEASDPTTLFAVAVLLGGAALLATFVPARMATRVDPVRVLSSD